MVVIAFAKGVVPVDERGTGDKYVLVVMLEIEDDVLVYIESIKKKGHSFRFPRSICFFKNDKLSSSEICIITPENGEKTYL